MFNVLEGDGVIENIYHFLWTKDTIFNTDPYVIIPHTILYKYQKPCYWYFTSIKDGKLKKKTSGKVNSYHIREVFTKHISNSGIIAYYIYKKNKIQSKYESDKPNYEKRMKNLFDKDIDEDNKSGYIMEYFDLKKFDEFLKNKFNFEDGILQKFEDPKGDYNITYRLNWSPKLCLFEKCTNIKKINDKKYDIYERAVTYDGEEFHTKTEPLKGSNLPDRIEKIGTSIANHVSNITLEKIKIVRMILNFKIDKKDRVLFLWCSSLRIDNKLDKRINNDNKRVKEVDINKINIRSPENINLFKYSINGKPIKPHKDAICINCGQKIESYRLYEISFKNLIESHENRKRDENLFEIYDKINMTSSGIEIIPYMENKNHDMVMERLKKYNYRNFIIPKVIMEIYPKMKYEDYINLKEDSIFCSKTACVCDSCYLDITKYCNMGGANIENMLKAMKKENINLPNLNNKNYHSHKNSIKLFNHDKVLSGRLMNSQVREYNKNSLNVKNNTNSNKSKNMSNNFNLTGSNFLSKIKVSYNNNNTVNTKNREISEKKNRPLTSKIKLNKNVLNKKDNNSNKRDYDEILDKLLSRPYYDYSDKLNDND
jgi:hypothetical protein